MLDTIMLLYMNRVNGCYVMIIEFLKLILRTSNIVALVTYCFMYWTKGVNVWWVIVLVFRCMHCEGLQQCRSGTETTLWIYRGISAILPITLSFLYWTYILQYLDFFVTHFGNTYCILLPNVVIYSLTNRCEQIVIQKKEKM